jgi:hypothetical protein
MAEKDKEKPASKKQAAGNGKVFDVRKPGKAPASPTSRPIIASHKPMIQETQAAVSGVGESTLMPKRKIEIKPLEGDGQAEPKPSSDNAETPAEPQAPVSQATEEEKDALAVTALDAITGPPPVESQSDDAPKTDTPEDAGSAEKPQEPEQTAEPVGQKSSEATAEPQPEPEKSADRFTPDASDKLPVETSSVPETEAPAGTEAGDGETSKKTGEPEPAPEPVIEPLFDDSGKIVVSHHNHHRHHFLKAFGLFLLIVLLAAVILNIMLDLELLTLEGIPHTDYL